MNRTTQTCSVLICVYHGDRPKYLRAALDSIFNQTIPIHDIVIVVDGKIGNTLDQVLNRYQQKHKTLRIIRLSQNQGVGAATNHGLKYCKNELVAKMDADDIAAPNRLELQLKEFNKKPKLTLLGGQLAEFSGSIKNIISHRKVPITEKAIKKFVRRRSPFNNQTVMYKKSAVQDVGGYPELNRAEDYYLFAKLIAKGYSAQNLSQTLVYFRYDREALQRRTNWAHTKSMIKVRNEVRKLGLSSFCDLFIVSAIQLILFLTPQFVAGFVYKALRK